uniref:Uncharacterized protein TCIL3000_8_8340 n=1 Tax=Trypanosoma congolense (strain IL3000) TaxID=1068625 RepID=G0UT91_TRYCI|nr:unnamed protein product [Trypanosoma congolense IL3000]
MYRRHFCTAGAQVLARCPALCRALSTGDGTAINKPRRVIRRVAPSDEEMAELHDVAQEAASEATCRSKQSVLSSVVVETMRFSPASGGPHAGGDVGELDDMDADGEEGYAEETSARCTEEQQNEVSDDGEAEGGEHFAPLSGAGLTDPLLNGTREVSPSCEEELSVSRSVAERQTYVQQLSLQDLVEAVVVYLRATSNTRLVSAEEEHALFPVLMERLNELHVDQMLDVVECHWARSTLVRYGIDFKDMVRDRIAVIATAAAKGPPKRALSDDAGGEVNASGCEDTQTSQGGGDHDDDDGSDSAVYVHEATENTSDLIILRAVEEMSADTVLRCIVVMGMSAGRRKRDLQFFQAMGAFLVHHINHYRDPHDLVRVLTAFARAKIVPPKRFLALLSRRFAVLNKRKPLGALPSYRALVNLFKMGHDQMNSFRFLADCIFEFIDSNVKAEKKRLRIAQLQGSTGETNDKATTTVISTPTDANTAPPMDVAAEEKESQTARPSGCSAAFSGDLDPYLLQNIKARERFKRLTELKPSMFTKLLLVLARFGAPHQQYLRPTTAPLIIPTLRSFPPPSFSRLLRAMSLFRTSDLDLIEPIINFMADDLGPSGVLPGDVLQVVRLVAPPDVPVPRNLSKLLTLCEAVYSHAGNTRSASGVAEKGSNTPTPIRPGDMCAVATVLLKIQMKEDVPLDALDPLTRLMEFFAERMYALMRLHIVSLTHVDIFTDLCRQQQHPDESGRIAQLVAERRRVNSLEGDDEYYSQLDIDVRETLHRILIVNDYNTYGQYRPTPGVLQVDFKQALTEVSAFDVLEASHLFGQAFPGAMKPAVERHLSRSIIAKLDGKGEEVITSEQTVVLRPPRELLLTREDLLKFVDLLHQTPLRRVKASPVVWRFVEGKAKKLKMDDVLLVVQKHLADSGALEQNTTAIGIGDSVGRLVMESS